MKIAFIVGAFPALSETFILNQITGLIDLGHEVDIYSRMASSQDKVHSDVDKYKLYARTYYLNEVPENKIKRILKALKLFAINFHKSPLTIANSLNIFKYGRDALSLYLFYHVVAFLRKQYDIIHCHFGPNGNFGITLREIGIHGKLITSFYGYDISSYIKSNRTNIYDELFCESDRVIAISEYMLQRLAQIGCPKKRLAIHHLCVDLKKFDFSEKKIKKEKIIKILTVARLVEKKGLEYSIKAIAKVMRKYSNIEYRIIGDGPLKEKLRILIKQHKLKNRIQLLGWMTQDEVHKYFTESHLFILPSITAKNGDQEGTPTVLIEAQAQGLSIVSTYHTGIPEVVQNGKSGFLVPERDADALAEKLEYLILHPEIWPKMGRTGRKYVEEHYDIKKLNQRLVEIYEDLLSESF